IRVGIPRNYRSSLRREALHQRKERAVVVEAKSLARHARTELMRSVYLNAHDGAGREMLVSSETALEVAHRNRKFVDRQVTARSQSNQRPALPHKSSQRFEAFFADTAAILRTNRLEVITIEN